MKANLLPKTIEDCAESLAKLPGIGPKSAMRLCLDLLKKNPMDVKQIAFNIAQLLNLSSCQDCGTYIDSFQDSKICSICADDERKDSGILCVVENMVDLLSIEQSQQFKGHYHLLGGVLNPLLGIGHDELRIDQLLNRLKSGDYHQIILAIGPSLEGDATCSYLKELMKDMTDLKLLRIGFGIPIGAHLQYVDSLTIKKALENVQLF